MGFPYTQYIKYTNNKDTDKNLKHLHFEYD